MTGFVRTLSEGFPGHRGRIGKQGGSMPKSAGASPASSPSAAPVTKAEPWQMTSKEWDTERKARGSELIDEWNKSGHKGFPPSLGVDTVKNRIGLAETAGYVLPRDADAVMKMDFHKLSVEAALKQGKSVPKSVLAEYPDLKIEESGWFPGKAEAQISGDPTKFRRKKQSWKIRQGKIAWRRKRKKERIAAKLATKRAVAGIRKKFVPFKHKF